MIDATDPSHEPDTDSAEADALEADINLVDAAMRHLVDGDLDAAEAALAGLDRVSETLV